MGDRENWTNRKVRKTELTENLCLPLSECRKVTTQKCFKHSHASMLNRNLGWVTGKTEPMEKFRKLNPQNFSSLDFRVWNISISHYEKIKKMAAISLISIVWKNFQLPIPPKFWSPVFRVSTEMECQRRPLWKNWKNGCFCWLLIDYSLQASGSLTLLSWSIWFCARQEIMFNSVWNRQNLIVFFVLDRQCFSLSFALFYWMQTINLRYFTVKLVDHTGGISLAPFPFKVWKMDKQGLHTEYETTELWLTIASAILQNDHRKSSMHILILTFSLFGPCVRILHEGF